MLLVAQSRSFSIESGTSRQIERAQTIHPELHEYAKVWCWDGSSWSESWICQTGNMFLFSSSSIPNGTGSSLAPSRWELELRRADMWICGFDMKWYMCESEKSRLQLFIRQAFAWQTVFFSQRSPFKEFTQWLLSLMKIMHWCPQDGPWDEKQDWGS